MENSGQDSEQQIESLLKQLHGQIKTSDWLEKNTANNLEEENPELIKAWKEAISSDESPTSSSSNDNNK